MELKNQFSKYAKEYIKKLNYQIEPYPKGDNKKYILGDFIKPIILKDEKNR